MPQFTYTAKKGLHETLEGLIEAESHDAAVERLIQQGLFPIRVETRGETAKEARAPDKPPRHPFLQFGQRVSSKELLSFAQQLTTLTRAQVDLLAALHILHEQAEAGRFKTILSEIAQTTKEGQTFSESLARFPSVFSPLFLNVVKAGEASGRLDAAFEQLASSMAREASLMAQVKAALAYPALLMLVGLGSIVVLMNVVVPKLETLFLDLGGRLPLMTRAILKLSHLSRTSSAWMALLGLIVAAGLVWRGGSAAVGRLAARVVRKLPVMSRLSSTKDLFVFASSFNLLLRSGVPALRSLHIVAPSLSDPRLRRQLGEVCEQVASGQGLSRSLQTHTALPGFFVKVIAVGEESGKLDEVLQELAASCQRQMEADIAIVSSLIEPLLILGLGGVLGTIILSVLLPIFQITQSVK